MSSRGHDTVGDIFYTLSVNFLLYVVLIIVFYMLVRFYLEEETNHSEIISRKGYARVSTIDDIELPPNDTSSSEGKVLPPVEQAAVNSSEDSSASGPGGNFRNSFLEFNDWGETEGTKQEVLQRLAFCSVGLVVTFSIWGLVQERMLTQTYDGAYFEFTYGLVFLNRLGGFLLSALLMRVYQVKWVPSPLWEYSFPSVANMLSSWCQYEALKYVSFPTQMLAKAFKLVPVMLMGVFLHNKSYESYEYVSATMIGIGLALFLVSSEKIDFQDNKNSIGQPLQLDGVMCGIVLLFLFLFFDSFTGQWQTRMFKLNKKMSPLQMMLIMNAFSVVFSFITLVHEDELQNALSFVFDHKMMMVHLAVFCVCSTVGQLFIFHTVKSFGAVMFSIIMSARILFSTLLSCAAYSHPVTELGFVGIIIVFGAISYRIRRLSEGQPLIRWKEAEETKVILHEWHEHLDI